MIAIPIVDRLKHAWNAFKSPDDKDYVRNDLGMSSSISPVVGTYSHTFSRSIIYAICNKMALDVSTYNIQHVRIDVETNRYLETLNTGLNRCLTVEANIDQTGRAFIQDAIMSMFDEGYVAIVPIETDLNPKITGAYDILSMRTAKIIEWYPKHIRVEIYNDKTGMREWLTLPKSIVAIVENPLYAVMNEPNGTMKRLVRKLILLDAVDEQSGSGKLDLIIQLPYIIKNELRQQQADTRRKMIEEQLVGSKYGIAYIDGTEHITQLNRPSENNLMAQVTYLTNLLYSQLGISEAVFNGTADEKAMLNYYDRTIEPIATALMDEMSRKFITKTARTQGHRIMGFRDVFRLIPANEIAEVADVFARNEILAPNEVRAILGMKPSDTEAADELRNRNMPMSETDAPSAEVQNGGETQSEPGLPREQVEQMIDEISSEYETTINDLIDQLQKQINDALPDEVQEDESS